MSKKLSYRELTCGDAQGLMKTYKMNARQLEREVLRHGGHDLPRSDLKDLYRDVYDKNNKRGGF